MNRDEITVPKKIIYRIAITFVLLLAILLLAWKNNLDHPQTATNVQPIAGGLKVGQPAPDFTLDTLDGNQVMLSGLKGKAILINFWASWCVPCREETPELVNAYNTHHAEGLVILGINMTSIDIVSDAKSFVAEFQIPYPVPLDRDGKVAGLYRVSGIPTSFFINRQGTITHIQIGKLTAEQIEQLLLGILPNS